jgi:uracil phosphoribosyltransferase
MLILIEHPLITHKLTQMRRKETSTRDFRYNLSEIAALMAYEITRDLPMNKIEIETPVSKFTTKELSGDVVLIPVLRAGLGMVEGITNLLPDAKVGHIGMYRNHETLKPITYFSKFPENLEETVVMVLDPMLATGGSASAAIKVIKEKGAKTIKLVSIVGAPEGVKRIEHDHPDVQVYLAALDENLNEKGYIVPGLGDAGDRLFGTI